MAEERTAGGEYRRARGRRRARARDARPADAQHAWAVGPGRGYLGLFTAQLWARVAGVGVALLSALASFAYIPYYPFWALVLLALAIAVIWALTAHGRDITA